MWWPAAWLDSAMPMPARMGQRIPVQPGVDRRCPDGGLAVGLEQYRGDAPSAGRGGGGGLGAAAGHDREQRLAASAAGASAAVTASVRIRMAIHPERLVVPAPGPFSAPVAS